MRRIISLLLLGVLCQYSENVKTSANVALKGIATQSSQLDHLTHAKNAIDGRQDVRYSSGSCIHTRLQSDPWWRVDLMAVHTVTSITVTDLDDCCYGRMSGAMIMVGNSLEDNGNNNSICAAMYSTPSGIPVTYQCNGMPGRYVNIFHPGCSKVISLCEVEVFAEPLHDADKSDHRKEEKQEIYDEYVETHCPQDLIPENLASAGLANQSSQYNFLGAASNAIDRKRHSVYYSGSCTHTNEETNPWWRVDLLDTYSIGSVTITNRGDCCSYRISGAEIHIGNDLDGANNPLCAVIREVTDVQTVSCKEMEGRYVTIVLPGKRKVLTLCEVEVHGANVAVKGIATQSSQLDDFNRAKNAIDGRPDVSYSSGSCIQTRLQSDPWWRVDLMAVHNVTSVTVTDLVDCCYGRLSGALILVGNSLKNNGNSNPVCAEISYIYPGTPGTYQCNGMPGRYVNIFHPGCSKVISLCEVEVYAGPLHDADKSDHRKEEKQEMYDEYVETHCPGDLIPENLASAGLANQSSQYNFLGAASNAIDRKRESVYYSGSCTHTNEETNPWWRVDLLDTYIIISVTITNRGDCCSNRISGAEIHIGNELDGANNPLCAVIPEMREGQTVKFFCMEMEGRYVTIVLPGKRKVLTLCEVEVHGIDMRRSVSGG